MRISLELRQTRGDLVNELVVVLIQCSDDVAKKDKERAQGVEEECPEMSLVGYRDRGKMNQPCQKGWVWVIKPQFSSVLLKKSKGFQRSSSVDEAFPMY